MYNMPTGVYVSEVISGGAAQKAGISKGAVITGLDGTEIDSMSTPARNRRCSIIIRRRKVTLTVQTPGKNGEYEKNDVEVTLGTNAQ
ncbi:MAG: PDZ domain-containing protein [[Clostridium] scindens]